ncbi:MAG: HAMP domain-containing protein [Candidatus Eisenbacteria bacterium]|nr:HAMP domain-containing protein [Candidatus Eisenbacteria bacterium]
MKPLRVSIGKKLGILFLAFLVLAAANLAVFLVLYSDFRDQRALVNVADRQGLLSQQIAYFAFMVNLGHDDHRAPLRRMVSEFDGTLAALEHGGRVGEYELGKAYPSMSGILHEVKGEWKNYWGSVLIVTELPRENPLVDSALSYIRAHSDRMLLLSEELSILFTQDPRHDWVRIRNAIFILFLGQLLLFGVSAAAVHLSIVRRLGELRSMSLSLAAGDMSARVKVSRSMRSNDEIGDLARSFNLMAENLQGAVAKPQEAKPLKPETPETEPRTSGASHHDLIPGQLRESQKTAAEIPRGSETILLAEDPPKRLV